MNRRAVAPAGATMPAGDAVAALRDSFHAAQIDAFKAYAVFRHAPLDLMGMGKSAALEEVAALKGWLDRAGSLMGRFAFLADSRALLGLRAAIEQARGGQGAAEHGLAQALALKAALVAGWGAARREIARLEYDAQCGVNEPFHGDFRP